MVNAQESRCFLQQSVNCKFNQYYIESDGTPWSKAVEIYDIVNTM